MRVGIDARPIQGRFTGDSTYWRGLIQALSRVRTDDEFIVYLDARLPEPEMPLPKGIEAKTLHALSAKMWSAWTFPRALRDDGVQIAHVQYTIPPRMPCPTVTTIHDVSFKRFPEFFALKDRVILDLAVRRARRMAARIIAVSQHAKSEIVKLYGVDPKRIAVTHEGADEQFAPMDRSAARDVVVAKYDIRFPFVLTVGVIQPRKNLSRLLEAFALIGGMAGSQHKLVIVGKYGWMQESLERRIRGLGLEADTVLTGYVPYEDLPAFYNAADVFVYPSVYEGFGLPPLEAMACGTPVVAGNRSSLPEVVGEAGILVDPYDPQAFADAMARVFADDSLRARMSARGLAQAGQFSWEGMARRVMAIYHEVAAP